MKITKNLPQFDNEKVLLIVTGRQEAEFYYAGSGIVEKISEFKVKKPTYSDHEGRVIRQGRGQLFGSGTASKDTKEKILQDFKRAFKKSLQTVLEGAPDVIYVYTPAPLASELPALFPKKTALRIKKIIRGNFYGRHPFEILKKITKMYGV